MIGIWSAYSDVFLVVAAVIMAIAFGLPLALAPMSWARVFRWEVPQQTQLAIFLGRSVGVFILILAIFAYKVTLTPAAKPFYFDLMLWTFAGMILLHIYGAIRKAQPVTETIEIVVWILLSLVTLGFYPV
jgi:hypothetical protein